MCGDMCEVCMCVRRVCEVCVCEVCACACVLTMHVVSQDPVTMLSSSNCKHCTLP